jgi:hypothetical protein
MGVALDKLIFDPAAAAEGANVGSYLRSSDGTLITHTTHGAKERLDVSQAGSFAEDSAHTTGDFGQFILAVRNDTEGTLVSADGDYAPLQVDALGRLRVAADIDVVTGAEKAEDSAHTSGDIGQYVLAVRQDTLASSVSADGDYGSFKLDSVGALWTRISQSPAPDAPNTAIAAVSVSVGTSEVALPVTALTSRKKLIVQNVSSNRTLYVGPTGVTTSSGLRISAGGSLEIELGPGITLYGIANGASTDVRVFQVA